MSKRRDIRLVMVAAALAIAGNAGAASTINGGDGCAILRQIIAAQFGTISAPGAGERFDVVSPSASIVPDTPLLCASTAASVSQAFSAAMHGAGIPVTWGGTVPIEYCLDRYLPNCYPIIGLTGAPAIAQEMSFVHDTWRAVTRSVMAAMPYGVASDMAVLDRAAFSRSLAIGLSKELSVNPDSGGRAPR